MASSCAVPNKIDFSGLKGLETSSKKEFCTIEATVTTGLELTAQKECNTLVEDGVSKVARGRVFFDIPLHNCNKVTKLRSVDNVYVVVQSFRNITFLPTKEENLNFLQDLPFTTDWTTSLDVFKVARNSDFGKNETRFRVTAFRNGEKHNFTSVEAARAFGSGVQKHFNWRVDMTAFDVEVILNIEPDQLYICLALTKESLHKRNILDFGPTVLRSTVCHNLVRLAEPAVGDIIVDPMCGSAGIPIEGSIAFPWTFNICGDSHPRAMDHTRINIAGLRERKESPFGVDAHQWNTVFLPLRPESVDIFITDLPFGKRLSSVEVNATLYPKVLRQMAFATRPCTGRAVIITHNKKNMIKSMKYLCHLWKNTRTLTINWGGLAGYVFLLSRTPVKWNEKAIARDTSLTPFNDKLIQ